MGWGTVGTVAIMLFLPDARPLVTIDVHYGAKKCNAGR